MSSKDAEVERVRARVQQLRGIGGAISIAEADRRLLLEELDRVQTQNALLRRVLRQLLNSLLGTVKGQVRARRAAQELLQEIDGGA